MNKRGISYQMILWIPRMVFLIIVFVVTFGLIFAFTTTTVSVSDAESHVLLHRLHFSPEGISKTDADTGRVYAGVVDASRISADRLETAIDIKKDAVAIRLVKSNTDDSAEVVAYLHEDTYRNWQPIAIAVDEGSIKKGAGRKFPYKESRYVYAETPAKLETVVIMPNE